MIITLLFWGNKSGFFSPEIDENCFEISYHNIHPRELNEEICLT
jgi:hypothetical protein